MLSSSVDVCAAVLGEGLQVVYILGCLVISLSHFVVPDDVENEVVNTTITVVKTNVHFDIFIDVGPFKNIQEFASFVDVLNVHVFDHIRISVFIFKNML
jgi:hypothetical protein